MIVAFNRMISRMVRPVVRFAMRFAVLLPFLLSHSGNCDGQVVLRYYGVDDIKPNEFQFLRDSLGGNLGMVEMSPDSNAWKNALAEAEKYDLNVLIWPLGSGHQWTPWAWDGSSWDISKGVNAMKYAERYAASGGKALLAVVMSHEPFYNHGDPFTADEMKMLYSALKEVAPHVKLFVYMNDMAYYDQFAATKIEDGIMDVAGIWLHCFGGAEGSWEDALNEIDRDRALVQEKGLNLQLLFAIQTFGIQGTKYLMPTAAEMLEFGTSVLEKHKLEGVFWYPWDQVASDYTSYLSKDRYDGSGQDRWSVVRQLSAYLPAAGLEENRDLNPERGARFELSQNHPNPFSTSTNIQFTAFERGFYTLRVHDLLGKEVATLFERAVRPGTYDVTFNANGFPSGLYLLALQCDRSIMVRKMMLK